MSAGHVIPMSDETFDRLLASFLASEAADISGAPTASDVAWRIAQRGEAGSGSRAGSSGWCCCSAC